MEKNITLLSNIRMLRTLKGIKVETMAKKLGISKGEYSKIENNYRKNLDKYIGNIASILDVNVELIYTPLNNKEEFIKLLISDNR